MGIKNTIKITKKSVAKDYILKDLHISGTEDKKEYFAILEYTTEHGDIITKKIRVNDSNWTNGDKTSANNFINSIVSKIVSNLES